MPMVFSCILFENDQKHTGIVIHKIKGNQPITFSFKFLLMFFQIATIKKAVIKIVNKM